MAEIQRRVRDRLLTPDEAAKYREVRAAAELDDAQSAALNSLTPGHRTLEDAAEMRHFIASLRAERERQQIDLAELARRTRYTENELANAEAGDTNPPIALLTRYARAVGKQVILSLRHAEPWCEPRSAAESTR